MSLTEPMRRETLLIDGQHLPSALGQIFLTYEPATGEVLAEVALAGTQDVELAVRAARRAFDDGPWPRLSAAERGRRLAAVSRLIRERQEPLAELESRNSGKALADARDEVGGAARTFEYYAGASDKLMGDTIPVSGGGLDFTLR